MEISLLVDSIVTLERLPSANTLLKINCPITEDTVKPTGKSSLEEEYIKEVVKVLKAYQEKTNNRSLCIHVKKDPVDTDNANKCLVRVHGFFWDDLDRIWMDALKLRVQLSFGVYSGNDDCSLAQLFAEIPIVQEDGPPTCLENIEEEHESCLQGEKLVEVNGVSFNRRILLEESSYYYHRIQIVANATITLFSESEALHPAIQVYTKLLDSKFHCDVVIVANDGTVFACHKNILAAHSLVLAAMLNVKMKESATNRIEIEDLSPDGVQALLNYLYNSDVKLILERCDIALELLQTGHKYDIAQLEGSATKILTWKPAEWFSIDVALNFFLFARQVDTMKKLTVKAVLVLMTKPREFLECKVYPKLWEECPSQAEDAVKELFCLAIKQTKWFNVDVAFELFISSRKDETMFRNKLRAASVLMSKPNEFFDCQSYKTLLKQNSVETANALKELFCVSGKQANWFNVDLAFRFFLSARKTEDEVKKWEAASVLMSKPDEFMECTVYKKTCKKNHSEAADSLKELFC